VVERVAQKMHIAALVGRLRQNFPQRGPQAGMIVDRRTKRCKVTTSPIHRWRVGEVEITPAVALASRQTGKSGQCIPLVSRGSACR
jgi:hypothetical protein